MSILGTTNSVITIGGGGGGEQTINGFWPHDPLQDVSAWTPDDKRMFVDTIRYVFEQAEMEGAQFYQFKGDFDMATQSLVETYEPISVGALDLKWSDSFNCDWTVSGPRNQTLFGVDHVLTPTLTAALSQLNPSEHIEIFYRAYMLRERPPFIIKYTEPFANTFFQDSVSDLCAGVFGYNLPYSGGLGDFITLTCDGTVTRNAFTFKTVNRCAIQSLD